MRYMLLIYTDTELMARIGQDPGMMAEYGAFTQGIVARGEFVAGDALAGVDTATAVRVRNGKTATTDGPFAETKEVLVGYYVVDAGDLDRAIEIAAKVPGSRTGTVEVRPIRDMSGPSH